MATVAIYNGFGKYETNDKKEKGITLMYGGVPFWLPYKKVTYLPDYTFREVDHDKTAAPEGEEGVLTYKTVRVSGARVAEELLETQIPVQNKEKGIIYIGREKKNQTGAFTNVYAGITEEGIELTAEVAEVEPTEAEVSYAERLARAYKEQVIQDYFLSKRERMTGGKGRLTPAGMVKVFMDELGVKDIDAMPAQQSSGSNLEALLAQWLAANMGGQAKKEDAAVKDLV